MFDLKINAEGETEPPEAGEENTVGSARHVSMDIGSEGESEVEKVTESVGVIGA